MEEKRIHNNCMDIMLFVGSLLGCIVYMIYIHNMGNPDILKTDQLIAFENLNLNDYNFVYHIVWTRTIMILSMLLVIKCFHFFLIYEIVFGGFSLYYSFTFCCLFHRFGLLGIVFTLLCFFPHYIFYGYAFFKYKKISMFQHDKNYNWNKNVKKTKYFVSKIVIFLMMVTGLFWEGIIQKNILNNFYQYLV